MSCLRRYYQGIIQKEKNNFISFIKKVNEETLKDPALVNKSAETAWLNCIKLSDEKDLDELLTKEQYDEFVKSLAHH